MGEWFSERVTRVAAWVVLAAILLSSLALGANRPVTWTLLSGLVTLAFVLIALFDDARAKNGSTTGIWMPAILFLGVLVWAIVQVTPGIFPQFAHPAWESVGTVGTISADPARGWHHIMRLASYAMIFWIAVRVCSNRERAYASLTAIGVFCTGLALFGIGALLLGENPLLPDELTYGVVQATFANRNNFATFAMMGVLANLALFVRLLDGIDSPSRRSRIRNLLEAFFEGGWIYAIGIIVGLGAIALSQSRAGTGASLIALLVFWLSLRSREQANTLVGWTIALVIGFIFLNASTGLVDRILTTSEEQSRFVIYAAIIDGLSERPLLGHGLGAFHETFRAHVPMDAAIGEWNMAHNSYLENAWELGIPAASVLYIALILIAFRLLRGIADRRRDRAIVACATAAMVGCGFHAVFDFSLQIPAVAAVFAWIVGAGWSQSFANREVRRSSKVGRNRERGQSPAPLPEA